jgi:tripartite-type tricarboxylate transporter receptor subunit TctC
MQRREIMRWMGAGAAGLALPTVEAQAQATGGLPPGWPNQPIKILIAFGAGGSTDAMMRVLAENAAPLFGVPVLVEAKPGAGGTLAPQQLLQTKPDGYTVAQVPLGFFRLPHTQKVAWDPAREISYVLNITGYSFGVAVPADSPIKTWADYVAYAKANPGKLSYGTSGVYTTPHITMEEISQRLGIELNHIPFKGVAEIMQAILGGQIMSVGDSLGFAPHVLSGKLRLLNTWGEARVRKFADVPTLKELGIPLVQASPYGFGVPKGTPPAVIQKLHDVFKKAMEMPNHVEALARYDQELMYMGSEQYRQFAEEVVRREKAVIDRLRAAGKVS